MNRMVKKFMVVLLSAFMFLGAVTTPVQAKGDGYYPTSIFDWIRWWQQPQPEEPAEPAPEETPAETEEPSEETEEEVAETEQPAEEPEEETSAADETVEVTEPAPEEASAAEETPVQEEVSYPAVILETGDELDGITVTVDAPEEALPEGVTMGVKKVSLEAVQAAVDNTENLNGTVVTAVDITFYDADGNVFEPLKEINVTITSDEIADPENAQVVHLDTTADEIEAAEAVEVEAEPVEAELTESTATFNAENFSIYAVIAGNTDEEARATVKFFGKDKTKPVETFYVKNSDVLLGTGTRETTKSYLEDIVYDPGVGTLDKNEVFRGWTRDENYSEETEAMDIDDIRKYLDELSIKEGDEVKFYAMIFRVITVTYLGEGNVSLGSETIVTSDDSIPYTVNMSYTPASSYQNFEGWDVSEGSSNIVGYTAGTIYENGTDITIKGNVTFAVEAPDGHWLVFDEVEKGATYVAPKFIKQGEVTVDPTADTADPKVNMQLNGYTFDGWYEDKEYTTKFTFGGELTDNKTIYAKWVANKTANYTVIIWKQNVNDAKNAADSAKTYDFAESITLSGNVGSTINTVTATGSGNGRYASVNGEAKRWEGFHLNKFDQNATIDTRGNSILNVYYDRNLVTLTFQYRANGRWNTQETMTGLYGSKLSSNGYTWPTNRWWYDDYDSSWGSYSGAGTRTTFLDAFIISGGSSEQTFYGFAGSGNKTVRFYKQDAEDANNYSLANTVSTGNGTFHISDKYNGFKASAYSLTGDANDWTELGEKNPSTGYYGDVNTYTNLYVLYDRLKYNILYMDGVYVDGNNNPVEGYDNRGQLSVAKDIVYESDISSYNKGGANYYAPTFNGFVFSGWYLDDQCQKPYTFTTMPEGIKVYAKWVQVQYRVFLHPNAGTDPSLIWGKDEQGQEVNQEMNFRISLGGKVSTPTGLRNDYEMVGWYLDEGCTDVFNADAFVLNDTTVTSAYDKTVDMTDPMDKWGNGATRNTDVDRPWITRKLDLYAKWRAILVGADGIGVIYNANGGSQAPTDPLLYKDSAGAIAQNASTAPEGKQFLYWVVQTWDKNKGEFVDTETLVYPGDTFTVLKANAKVVENEDSTEEKPSFTYTVQLRAEYGDKQQHKPTHIDWYKNDANPSELLQSDKNLQINEAIDIYREIPVNTGYKFLGWAREREYEIVDGAPQGEPIKYYDVDEDDLFLKYDAENNKYQAKNKAGEWVDVTQIAADEALPYHAMYAVWQEEYFYIYHSSDNRIEKIGMGSLPVVEGKKVFDITSKVAENYMYGGYYSDYARKGKTYTGGEGNEKISDTVTKDSSDNAKPYAGGLGYWSSKKNAITENGTSMTPVANKTYYLKEVPNGFLATKLYVIYDAHNNNTVVYNYLISDVDDNNYSNIGLVAKDINTGARIKLATSYTINDTFNGESDRISAEDFGMNAGYVAVWQPGLATKNFEVAATYTTPDGVVVEGKFIRMIDIGDGTYKGNFTAGNDGFSITERANENIKLPGYLKK